MAKNNTPKDVPTKPVDDAPNDGVVVAEEVDETILPEETTGALVKLETVNIAELLSTGKGVDEILAEVRRQTVDIVPDLSTDKGRKQIRALAYRVSRTRALMDKKRLEHTQGLRDEIKKLNGNGDLLLDGLATIRDEVRKPLTEWEAMEDLWQEALIEDARREAEARERAEQFEREVQQRIDTWRGMPAVVVGMSVAEVEATLNQYEQMELAPELFGDRVEEATAVRDEALRKVESYLTLQRKTEELEAQAAAAATERQAAIDAAEEAARAKAARDEAIDRQIRAIVDDSVALANRYNSEQITELLGTIERETYDPAGFGDRLGDAYAARTVAADKVREILVATQEREAEAARLLAEQKARERRDWISGQIQGIQTKPLITAAACGTADMLQLLRDETAADELDPANFDDRWQQALDSRVAVLAKLDELIATKRQAEADAADAARLRQEAAEREAQAERDRQAEQARAKQAANEAHRTKIRSEAANNLGMIAGMVEAVPDHDARKRLARTLMAAIEAGEIPNVEIHF